MSTLYPFKFSPIYKEKVWGGNRLKNILGRDISAEKKFGESWDLSGVEGDVSVVSNGFLKDNTLEEIIEVYMGDIVGDSVFDKFGLTFPLLIKFIDANDNLSIQVHPDDIEAKKRHNSFGKTEMWHVIDCDKGSKLIMGFNKELTKESYQQHVDNGTIEDDMNQIEVEKGDSFFVPSGRIHAIGGGNLIAEIQQVSDITYRIFDWNRVDEDGKSRELHTKEALDVLDFSVQDSYKTDYSKNKNVSNEVTHCDYFNTNYIKLTKEVDKDYIGIDSFVIYMCVEGDFEIIVDDNITTVKKGETILLPAMIKNVQLNPKGEAHILEVFIDNKEEK